MATSLLVGSNKHGKVTITRGATTIVSLRDCFVGHPFGRQGGLDYPSVAVEFLDNNETPSSIIQFECEDSDPKIFLQRGDICTVSNSTSQYNGNYKVAGRSLPSGDGVVLKVKHRVYVKEVRS